MRSSSIYSFAVALAVTLVAGFGHAEDKKLSDIVDTAVAAGKFNTLVAAVKAAGLVETLKGEGPFTVFAPTDEAFAKIPKDKLEALLKDKEQLTAILTYHVVPDSPGGVVKLDSAKTVQGRKSPPHPPVL
jgi:uncharacterized surface protein with fasciclin (FAS1) repeats